MRFIAVLLVGLSAGGTAAVAAPYYDDDYFSTATCGELWEARNEVYKNAGYCFKTAKAIRHFGNAGCSYDDMSDVPLSPTQRRYVAKIQRYERQYRCPK